MEQKQEKRKAKRVEFTFDERSISYLPEIKDGVDVAVKDPDTGEIRMMRIPKSAPWRCLHCGGVLR